MYVYGTQGRDQAASQCFRREQQLSACVPGLREFARPLARPLFSVASSQENFSLQKNDCCLEVQQRPHLWQTMSCEEATEQRGPDQ